MTHINVRQDNESAMRAYASRMPEIAQEMGKYSWVKSLGSLPVIAKLTIGLIAYPVAYLRDWCNQRSIKQHTLEEASKATMKQLQTDVLSVDLPARRVFDSYDSITPDSELDLGFLEKTTSRYRERLQKEAEQFIKNQFPFPCVVKPQTKQNTDEVDTDARSVHITNHYEIYYEDSYVGSLTVTSQDQFSAKNAQGKTTYGFYPDLKSVARALERHHLNIFKDYLFSSCKLDINRLTIETRHFESRFSETNLGIRNKYNILYDGISIGEVSFRGNFEMRNGKTQGSMKHHYKLFTRKFEKRKRAKVSI